MVQHGLPLIPVISLTIYTIKNNYVRGRLKAFSDDLLHISLEGMMILKRICLSVPIAVSLSGLLNAAPMFNDNPVVYGKIKVQSWKERRDFNIVKQDLDFSCGAASVIFTSRDTGFAASGPGTLLPCSSTGTNLKEALPLNLLASR